MPPGKCKRMEDPATDAAEGHLFPPISKELALLYLHFTDYRLNLATGYLKLGGNRDCLQRNRRVCQHVEPNKGMLPPEQQRQILPMNIPVAFCKEEKDPSSYFSSCGQHVAIYSRSSIT